MFEWLGLFEQRGCVHIYVAWLGVVCLQGRAKCILVIFGKCLIYKQKSVRKGESEEEEEIKKERR
jgi:hypothetical protein